MKLYCGVVGIWLVGFPFVCIPADIVGRVLYILIVVAVQKLDSASAVYCCKLKLSVLLLWSDAPIFFP